ncbi:MAG: hypothetical protein BWY71_00012 [Planctomycetes bacterium ADurb.Bin412]|nr:MAG: hypothetical protein BWY71_00012 [Planctomycetes bacterium ADurb.Bin412]
MAQTALTLTSTIPCDLDGNFTVDILDLGIFAYHWLETGCTGPETCGGADFDASGKVDYLDYAIFSQCWP